MVPSNFKQNVKENANLGIERTREDNSKGRRYIAEGKLIFLNDIYS
jgi:hypothetical protein